MDIHSKNVLQLPAINEIKVKMPLPQRVNYFRAKKNTLPATPSHALNNKTIPSQIPPSWTKRHHVKNTSTRGAPQPPSPPGSTTQTPHAHLQGEHPPPHNPWEPTFRPPRDPPHQPNPPRETHTHNHSLNQASKGPPGTPRDPPHRPIPPPNHHLKAGYHPSGWTPPP